MGVGGQRHQRPLELAIGDARREAILEHLARGENTEATQLLRHVRAVEDSWDHLEVGLDTTNETDRLSGGGRRGETEGRRKALKFIPPPSTSTSAPANKQHQHHLRLVPPRSLPSLYPPALG